MTRLWSLLRALLLVERPQTIATCVACDQCEQDDYCAPLRARGRVVRVCGDCLQRALQLVERAEAIAERSVSDV